MKYSILFLCLINLFASGISEGEKVFTGKGCYGCHGIDAGGNGNYPKLANRSEEYLIDKLTSYKSGKIKTGNADVMNPFAQSLNEDEIKQVAKYLSNMQENLSEDSYELGDDPWDGGGS